jgi:hypothetical protein
MKKYVINLKRRTDRLEQIKLPFDFEIFEATDGQVEFSDYPVKQQGFMGCWDSHQRLFTEAKNKNIDTIMVLEDDIEVCEVERYSESLNRVKNVLTTHAFIVRSKFYDTILESINSRKWKVDILISEALSKGNCFICDPTIAWQKEGFSDIENRVTNNIHLK